MGYKKYLSNKFSASTFLLGVLFVCISIMLALAFISYNPHDRSFNHVNDLPVSNSLGFIGSYSADLLLKLFGLSSLLFVIIPLFWSTQCLVYNFLPSFWFKFTALLLAILLLSTLLAGFTLNVDGIIISCGGAVGDLFYNLISVQHKLWIMGGLAVIFIVCVYFSCGAKLKSWYDFAKKLGIVVIYISKLIWYSLRSIYRVIKLLIIKFKKNKNAPYPYADLLNSEEKPDSKRVKSVIKVSSMPRIKAAGHFSLPTVDLLSSINNKSPKNNLNTSMLEENAERLLTTLSDFGVRGKILGYYPGPVVTLYELEPAAGTKSSRIIGLADDIARSMCALSTRIATIPGKNSIGVELPNNVREMVYLKEMIESPEYINNNCELPIILGKDISGSPIIVDLATMPHLLVAGTTGSGKSVAINTMILSLLYNLTPEQCKLVMIDPKMLELSVYDGIPHLLAPVVTEPSKAVTALKWTVKEMENRYRLMSNLGVRNISGYNAKIEESLSKGSKLQKRVQTGFSPENGRPIYEDVELDVKRLPYIVVIVDEMADLMIVAGKEIEASVQRLAQMARAAGIHIIMATQRPSVDVITGVIKANFPTRISFQVTSKIDSRTILGDSGAEQLLGKGDMLYMSGGNKIKRIHGPFVADQEVNNVVEFLKQQAEPVYTVDITENEEESFNAMSIDECDELYDQAVSLITRERKISISYIQRYFRIGYNRSATIVEQMEKNGVVSKPDPMGKREILANETHVK
jgi:S-DNA-T family DNA segregation ATPase FtsK/SpoIIIE